jgi:hypothetical protein
MRKRPLLSLIGLLLLTFSCGCGSQATVHERPTEELSPKGRVRRAPNAEEVSKQHPPKNK